MLTNAYIILNCFTIYLFFCDTHTHKTKAFQEYVEILDDERLESKEKLTFKVNEKPEQIGCSCISKDEKNEDYLVNNKSLL
jgi:hypothetical protein